jgi:hypothetical protein
MLPLLFIFILLPTVHAYNWILCLSKNYTVASASGANNWLIMPIDNICDGYIDNYIDVQDPTAIQKMSNLIWSNDPNGDIVPLCKHRSNTKYNILIASPNTTIYFSYFNKQINGQWSIYNTGVSNIYRPYISNLTNQIAVGIDNCSDSLCIGNFTIPIVKSAGYYKFIWIWYLGDLYRYSFYSCFDVYIDT